MQILRLFLILFLATFPGSAQRISIGLIGGGSPTEDFHNRIFPPVLGVTPGFATETAAKRYLFGASIEFRADRRLSIEVDAIYRPLRFVNSTILVDGTRRSVSPATVVTWEFPVLAKVRLLSDGRVRPFFAGGPNLRTAGNLNGARPRPYGITGALGLEIRTGILRVSPSVRYTRWAPERGYSAATTRQDQIEVMMGISGDHSTLVGSRVRFGLLAGGTLTEDYQPASAAAATRGPLVGPWIDIALTERFAVEAGAVYHPLRVRTESQGGTRVHRVNVTWEIPLLAKLALAERWARPFIAAGPSFRLPQEINGARLANIGLAAEVGLEWRWWKLRVAPAIRYTRWRQDSAAGRSGVGLNQAALLFKVSR